MGRLDARRRATAALGLFVVLSIAGCESAEDQAFMSDCQSRRGFSEAQCSCVKDLINDSVPEEKGRTWLKALVVGDQSRAAQVQSTFGLLEGGRILARSGWLATNAPQACGVTL
jgi:hypothetical protein